METRRPMEPPPSLISGVGVVEKCMAILDELARGPLTVQSAAKLTGVSRATTHRLIKTLELHRLVVRDLLGRYAIGPRLVQLAGAREVDPLNLAIERILIALANWSGLEAFLFWAHGTQRICIAATGCETSAKQIGRLFEPSDSSTSQVLLAWSARNRLAARGRYQTTAAAFTQVRKNGFAYSINNAGWAGTSAPVRDNNGEVIGAVTLYGRSKVNDATLPPALGAGVKTAGERLSQTVAELATQTPERNTIPVQWQL